MSPRDEGAGQTTESEIQSYEIHAAIRKAATFHRVLTSDDVWAVLEAWEIKTLNHPNAMGAAFRRAANRGLIENTGTVWKSVRKGSRKRAIAVWKSAIYAGGLE